MVVGSDSLSAFTSKICMYQMNAQIFQRVFVTIMMVYSYVDILFLRFNIGTLFHGQIVVLLLSIIFYLNLKRTTWYIGC